MSLIYLLQITAVWLVCYLFYLLWLRSENLPEGKRYFLLGAFMAGPLLPLFPALSWPGFTTLPLAGEFVAQLETITIVAAGNTASETTSSIHWLFWLWGIGSVFSLFRLLGGWAQLFRLIRNGKPEQHEEGYQLVQVAAGASPFSYGNYLFWPADLDLDAEKWAAVKAHERAHIQQGHTYDLLLIDLLAVLFWWNPFPYLYRQALRLQHEYLADAAATKIQKSNVRDYARLLLQHQLVGWVPRPGHAFHHSYLKNRIIMLTQPKGASWKLLAILPLFVALLWACNEESSDITGVNIAETEANMANEREGGEGLGEFEIINGLRVYKKVDRMPIYGDCSAEIATGDMEEAQNCGNTKLLMDIYQSVKYPKVSREYGAEGMAVLTFVVPAEGGKARDIQLLRKTSQKPPKKGDKGDNSATVTAADDAAALQTATEKEAYDALDAAAMEAAKKLPQDWTAGIHEGKPVAVRFNLPIKFKLQ